MASTETAKTEHADHGHAHHGDPSDPHYEEHHVVSWQLLTGVLFALFFLTAVTVGAAYIHLGEALNVFVALAIATVKGTLVAAIFMHLRWDKPINAIILIFSVMLLGLFLFMSILDSGIYQKDIIPEYSKQKMDMLRTQLPADEAHGEGEGQGADESADAGMPADAQDLQSWAAKVFRSTDAKKNKVSSLKDLAGWPSKDYELTEARVQLGRMLYHDPRLSTADDISCATCHDLAKGGIDPREPNATSAGHTNLRGEFNSPTVYNAALHNMQFWDGRAKTLEEQALGPITNPVEMAMGDNDMVVAKLKAIDGYAEPFKAAFGGDDPITIEHVGEAIGAFERKLLTPAPFDDFLAGDLKALSEEQYAGLRTFKEVNCLMCHSGLGIGGTMMQKFGLQGEYGGHPDEGEMFKTPGLRNVTLTAPYLHDGSEPDLGKVVRDMAKYQLAVDLNDQQTKALLAFLKSLEGTPPAELIKAPELPE